MEVYGSMGADNNKMTGMQIKALIDEKNNMGYAPVTKLNLSTEKLKSLGWKPQKNLYCMFNNLIQSMKDHD